jgi:F-type H+-transporting ATPase subunit gamma
MIVSTDRGLCGGLNSQPVPQACWPTCASGRSKGVEIDVVCIGQKATAFFRRLKVNMTRLGHPPGREAAVEQLIGVIKVMLDAYAGGNLDKRLPVLQRLRQHHEPEADADQLLPLPAAEHSKPGTTGTTSTNPAPRSCSTMC